MIEPENHIVSTIKNVIVWGRKNEQTAGVLVGLGIVAVVMAVIAFLASR